MNKFILLLLLCFVSLSVNADVIDYSKTNFPPLITQNAALNSADFREINRMEKILFKRNFENDTVENRIGRLEERIFGTMQDGNLKSRYLRLQKVISHSKNYKYETVPNAYYKHPKRTRWQSMSGSFGNFLNFGVPTGFSPQINTPYVNNYSPDFHRGFYSNHGWHNHNMYRGSGLGVHIMD